VTVELTVCSTDCPMIRSEREVPAESIPRPWGERTHHLRANGGLSQPALAEHLGISVATVRR
jgi:DNA-binding transcriptional regulator YiaG